MICPMCGLVTRTQIITGSVSVLPVPRLPLFRSRAWRRHVSTSLPSLPRRHSPEAAHIIHRVCTDHTGHTVRTSGEQDRPRFVRY